MIGYLLNFKSSNSEIFGFKAAAKITSHFFVRDTVTSPFVNHKRKDVNTDWLAVQWNERSILGHARITKGRMKGDDPQIDNAQIPKRFDGRWLFRRKSERLSLIVSRTN